MDSRRTPGVTWTHSCLGGETMKPIALLRAASLFATGTLLFTASNLFAQDTSRVVLKGHDPVAYFTEGRATKGDPKISVDWDGGRYHFATARHREMFSGDPERYAPQFGGYCTGSMSAGKQLEADPEAWVIVDGRLYMFGAMKFKELALNDRAYVPSKIPGATRNWKEKK
jgi:YHS domain-containing protein